MSFLSPLALLLAAAALIPLLLHLRRGRVTRVVEFPGARYLARATLEHQRALRARSSLLLLVRIAIVLALALAAARPLASAGGGHGPTALAIVIDNSASSGTVVGGRSVLDASKDAARALLRTATAQDRLWLFTADGSRHAGTASELLATLDSVRPLAGAGRPRDAAATAIAAVERLRDLTPSVAITSDGQATAWRSPVTVERAAVTLFQPPAGEVVNRAVAAVTPVPARWAGRGSLRVGVAAPDSVPFRVVVDGRTVARGAAPPLGTTEVGVPVGSAGWVVGRVEIARDELAADDSRWFAVWQGDAPLVDAAGGRFVDQAVAALSAAGTVRRGDDIDISAADALRGTPALVLAPLEPARIGAANRALARAGIPWRYGAERRSAAPLRGAGVDGAIVTQRFALVPTASAPAETLATVDGEPWAVAGDGYVVVASAVDTAATTLPVTAEFVPWLARLLVERLAPGGAVREAAPGSVVTPPLGADALARPDGVAAPASATTTVPQLAGVYFWTRDSARIGALVVNVEAEESDVRRATEDELAAVFTPRAARVAHDAAAFTRHAFDSQRRPVSSHFVALALLLLLVEAAIVGAMRAPRSAVTAAGPAKVA